MSSLVKKLVYYGQKHLGLNNLDAIYVSNILYRKLNIQYSEEEVELNYIDDLVDPDACTLTFKPTLKKKREINKKPKYVYNCECGKEITSKTPLNVSCSDCQSNFELNEDKSKNTENS